MIEMLIGPFRSQKKVKKNLSPPKSFLRKAQKEVTFFFVSTSKRLQPARSTAPTTLLPAARPGQIDWLIFPGKECLIPYEAML
jgi:hypothetical protein